MESKVYKYILFIITLNVLATIGLQVFWNIKNYKETKRQLINEVQTAFDKSIEYYYVEDSKNDFVAIIGNDSSLSKDDFFENLKLDTVFKKRTKKKKDSLTQKDTIDATTVELESIEYHEEPDEKVKANDVQTISYEKLQSQKVLQKKPKDIAAITILKGKKASELFNVYKSVPQILENVTVKNKNIINSKKCKQAIIKAIKMIKNNGRLLVRKSGTEPKIRIMGESHNKSLLIKCMKIINNSIKNQ